MEGQLGKELALIREHVEKEFRSLYREMEEDQKNWGDPEKTQDGFKARWAREREELEESINEDWDASVVIAMSARAIALHLLLRVYSAAGVGAPEWTPEIGFFSAMINAEEILETVRREFEPDEDDE